MQKKSDKEYVFLWKNFKYQGKLVEETETHFILIDRYDGEVRLPKVDTVVKESKEEKE